MRFTIVGFPIAQGSKKPITNPNTGRTILIEENKDLPKWRSAVAKQVRRALPAGWQPLDGPVSVDLTFRLPRPAPGAPGSVVAAVYPIHQQSGDTDKLQRAILDALTAAGVYTDDCRVTDCAGRKRYPGPGEWEGVTIDVHWTATDPGGPRPIQDTLTAP